jgi:hypothetical protein
MAVTVACATAGKATDDTDAGEGGTGNVGAPCAKNDDCTAPNLCQGNNGVTCKNGYCVQTGMPQNCDNGVPCTQS